MYTIPLMYCEKAEKFNLQIYNLHPLSVYDMICKDRFFKACVKGSSAVKITTGGYFMKKLKLLLPIFLCMILLASCSQKKEITSVNDLPGSKMGVQIGTTGVTYAGDYEGDDAGSVVEKYNKGVDAIQALRQNKIDCVIIDEEPAKVFAEKNKDLIILSEEFVIEDYAICIAKENSELKEKVNAALAEIKADKTLEALEKNYTGTDEEKGKTPYQIQDIERPNGTLVMATNAQFPPYEYYENGEITGLDVDIMKAICDRLGMTLKIEDMEFEAIISAVQFGKADVGVAGMTVNEDRLKSIDFTDSYTTSKQVIIVKDPNAKTEKLSFAEKFKENFIVDQRWQYLTKGLLNTLIITVFATIIGIILGFLMAIIRTSHDKNGSFKILNFICRLYLTIMRATPVMVQILIIYYVIFAAIDINKILVAIISFGLNSAAYVAEVVRSGIMAVDEGQFEAGRSLGMTYRMTMIHIIMPQAIKNILPALGNEFIVLLKETSISGYIGLSDLTRGGVIIQSITYEALLPLLAVALIYLVIVLLLSSGVNKLERRMRNNER